jgi:hypothetical protein
MSYDEETTMDDVQMSFDVLGVLCVEGSPTGDGRMIDTNSLRWSLPLPLRRVREDFGAHNGAVVVGAIEKIERTETGELAYSGKLFDTADGRACRDEMYTRYMSSGLKYGISVDLDDVVVEDDADVMVVKSGQLRGATLCDIPAYATAYTMLSDQVAPSLVASAPRHGLPTAWFLNPRLDGPTPLTVTAEGRVYGHAALWDTCHTGFADMCIRAPRSATNYAYYRTGAVVTAEGDSIPVGHITMGTGHANPRSNAVPAAEHYDNTGAAVADVAAGEDEFGIWLAGSIREGVTDEQVREMRASAVSGDWRTIDGNLELVAMLSVNVPGFPVPRMRAMVAGGVVQSLVASAVFDSEDVVEEPSTEMPPAEVAAALEPEAEESKVKAEMGDDAEEKVDDQPDAEDAEEATEEEVEDGEMDMAATMGEMRDMMRAMSEEIRMMKESMAMPAIAGDEPALADAPAEDAEPVEPLPAVENAVSAEEMLKMLDEMVNGKPDMTKLLAELDAKVG